MTMRRIGQARVDQRGFTLAELLVAIAIVGLVMTGLLTLLQKGNESYLAGANQVEVQSAIRAALERMTQDIREAGYDPTGLAGFPAITNQTATSFSIQNDWDGNGAINPAITVCVTYSWAACPNPGGPNNRGEQIDYSIVGGTLQRREWGVDAVAQPFVTNVVGAAVGSDCAGALVNNPPIFQFCDAGGNPGIPPNIRTVVVNVQAGVQGQTPGSWKTGAVQVTMSDRIRLRNRIP